jgi:hypothetical protein
MEIKGKVVSILEVQTGTSAKGEWRKGGYVIETLDDKYPKKIAIDLFNDNLDDCPTVGEVVKSYINIESREYNGKYYTNIGAWKIEKEGATQENNENTPVNSGEETDDLPF